MDYETGLAELVNELRGRAGLAPLEYDEELSSLARTRATDLMARGCLTSSMALGEALYAAGLTGRIAKENLAAGPKNAPGVLQSWLENSVNSSALKNPNYNCQGVGFVRGGTHGTYWVQILARKRII